MGLRIGGQTPYTSDGPGRLPWLTFRRNPLIKKSARRSSRARSTLASRGKLLDAVALLKADHRQVGAWFKAFSKSRSASRKQKLATMICNALTVHMAIEEGIFYPAFLRATQDLDMHHEAIVEHAGAKSLIRQIRRSSPANSFFASKVKVLGEQITHHVEEEEEPGGMFAEARKSGMDLRAVGGRMAARKKVLARRER